MKPVDLALLFIRLALGIVFVMHGLQKVAPSVVGGGPGMAKFGESLAGLNIPYPAIMAWVAALTELVGGALVGIGLFARIAALGLAGVMTVAVLKVHLASGFFGPAGYEYPMVLGVLALAIVIAGPGQYSIAAALPKKSSPKKPG